MLEMEDLSGGEGEVGGLDFMLSPQIEPNDKMYPNSPPEQHSSRRGRPKAAMISNLILEGSVSKNGIRCDICSRVFPRDKSLQAHRRVHTGERPYSCDYPGCTRKFKQSGQLKTHQRLHTGERPFICSVQGCSSRFTHANRHCSAHPSAPLLRSDDYALLDSPESNQSEEVKQWLTKYRAERREARSEQKKRADSGGSPGREVRTTGGGAGVEEEGTPRQAISPAGFSDADVENRTPQREREAAPRKSLFTSPDSPRKRELPKKRWLRIAWIEQECLANQNRPTVLRHAPSSCFTPPSRTQEHTSTWSRLGSPQPTPDWTPLSGSTWTRPESPAPVPDWTPLREAPPRRLELTPLSANWAPDWTPLRDAPPRRLELTPLRTSPDWTPLRDEGPLTPPPSSERRPLSECGVIEDEELAVPLPPHDSFTFPITHHHFPAYIDIKEEPHF